MENFIVASILTASSMQNKCTIAYIKNTNLKGHGRGLSSNENRYNCIDLQNSLLQEEALISFYVSNLEATFLAISDQ
jgi:hypothetical protein